MTLIRSLLIIDGLLRQARARLDAAKSNSKEALMRYTSIIEAERVAQAEVTAIEERIDGLGRFQP